MRRADAVDPPAGALTRLALVALAVTAVDLASKLVALATVPASGAQLGGPFFLTVVFNAGIFGGAPLDGWAQPVSFASTAIVLGLALLVCAPLAEREPQAPWMLGLVSGAALANAASLVLTPQGVPDFLGVNVDASRAIVFNLADVAAYAGVGMACLTITRLWRDWRQEVVRPAPVLATARARTRAVRRAEREIALPTFVDGPRRVVLRRAHAEPPVRVEWTASRGDGARRA